MVQTIGIPRALYYYQYYPFWKKFFTGLGLKVCLSAPTCKSTLDKGVSLAVDGTCLPVKVYYGHVAYLVEQQVDFLWVPQIISVATREYICPKFMGLPDMIGKSFPQGPKILSPAIDGSRSRRQIFRAYIRFATEFAPFFQVLQAYWQGLQEQHLFQRLLSQGYYLPSALELAPVYAPDTPGLTIGLLGHSYLLYDSFISMNILTRLLAQNIRVVTAEHLDEKLLRQYSRGLPKRMFWTSGQRILGAAAYLTGKVDGIISVSAFACGTDSLTSELVQRQATRQNTPHLLLNLDEHTGEAGMLTRVEAFLDMLERRKLA